MWPSEVLIEEDFTVSLSQELQRSNLLQKNISYIFFSNKNKTNSVMLPNLEILEIYISSLLELATVRAKIVGIYFLGNYLPYRALENEG